VSKVEAERDLLHAMFEAAVAAAMPGVCIARHHVEPPKGRTIVIGAGKASAAMAQAFERQWAGPLSGLVVTRYGHAVPCERIEIVEASHPVPDQKGRDAAGRILELVKGLSADDLVVALISGGGSALLSLPADGLSFEDKRAVNSALLKSGAPIGDMNVVRKHLSAIKGGRLAAAAYPAKVVTLVISDVPGDDPSSVASGPTVADASTFADALAVLNKYKVDVPERVLAHLKAGADETPKAGDHRLARNEVHLIASPQASLEAAAEIAQASGFGPILLGDAIEGEAREVARDMAAQALAAKGPCVLISGGETTVTVRGKGRGGRNVEFLLALAIALDGARHIYALAGDTDGIDGAEEVAGAIVTPDSLARARRLGLDAQAMLDDNDAHRFFEVLGDRVITGPTLTNVNDFRAILVLS
jgi:glycerate 2-kinase